MNDLYPLFVPPQDLATRTPPEWSTTEAKRYLDWLVDNLDERVSGLTAFLKEDINQAPEDLLMKVGQKAVERLREPQFSVNTADGPQLTIGGHALAADMGLLVAKLIVRDCAPVVHWAVLSSPKSDVSYNCAVLKGFGKRTLDPVGGSIAEAHGVLRGERGPDTWKQIYRIWKGKTIQ